MCRGDLALNLALAGTLLWLPLTFAAVGRAIFVNYRFTDKRVSVTTTTPLNSESFSSWGRLVKKSGFCGTTFRHTVQARSSSQVVAGGPGRQIVVGRLGYRHGMQDLVCGLLWAGFPTGFWECVVRSLLLQARARGVFCVTLKLFPLVAARESRTQVAGVVGPESLTSGLCCGHDEAQTGSAVTQLQHRHGPVASKGGRHIDCQLKLMPCTCGLVP